MSKETKEEIIAILSEMRSDYNCFDANEEPKYRALSVAIKAINDEPTVVEADNKVVDESFQHKYPDWYLPKLVCANVNCKYNGFRNACTCPQVKLSFRHLHTTFEGLIEVFECKSFEEQKPEEITRLEDLMEFINKHSVYRFTCKEKDDADNND